MAGFMDRVADFGEKTKLNMQIREMEKQRIGLFTNAGTLVYNLSLSGSLSIPECEAIFAEITALNNRIEETKKQIARIDEMRLYAAAPVKPNGIPCVCGMVNAPDARFCAGCGRPVTAPPVPPAPPVYDAPGYTAPPAAPAYAEPEYSSTEYAPEADEANIGVCPSCGFTNTPEAIFCANCGKTLIGGIRAGCRGCFTACSGSGTVHCLRVY